MAVAELAWSLYRYCNIVARGAPEDFQLLLQEITVLSQSIKLLQEEAKDPNSVRRGPNSNRERGDYSRGGYTPRAQDARGKIRQVGRPKASQEEAVLGEVQLVC